MGLPKPYYTDDYATIYHGDCRDVMQELSGVTAIVSDPPYGLSFMGKDWDHGVPGVEFWRLIAGACLPGAPMLAFGGTRTYHRLVCAIEDAGWEIRDCLQWIYGSGFPKSLDVSKAIDKAAGAEREVVGVREDFKKKKAAEVRRGVDNGRNYNERHDPGRGGFCDPSQVGDITAPATDAAKQWDGYGTALKPAHEPICLAMKPLDGTFAANALEHGVAGLNVDGGRVAPTGDVSGWSKTGSKAGDNTCMSGGNYKRDAKPDNPKGRWPANILHDGSEEVLAGFPVTGSNARTSKGLAGADLSNAIYNGGWRRGATNAPNDTGSAARFFYAAKSSKRERNFGLDKCEIVVVECWKQSERTLSWENADHKVRLLMDTGQSPSRVIAVSGAQTKDASEWNTILFGSGNTGQSLMDAACTTVMGTSSTIDSPTLNLLLTLNTSGSTAVARSATENGGSPAENAEHGALYLATTSARMASALGADSAVLPMRLRISGSDALDSNRHPTVKNLSLMRYLCTLVTMPERNLILDPFAGSGTTGVACKQLGLPCILIEQDEHHCEIIAARIVAAKMDEVPGPGQQGELPL